VTGKQPFIFGKPYPSLGTSSTRYIGERYNALWRESEPPAESPIPEQ